jgi:mono/diheme cytochrome c family protein
MRSIFLAVSLLAFSLSSVASFAAADSKSDNKEGKEVFELTCKSCHMPKGDGHASLDGKHKKRTAPPMAMVKKRYLNAYPERDDFVKAVADWAAAPSQDSSLLKRAVKHHGVMPAQMLKEDSLKKVAAYIYDEDMGKAGCGMHGGKEGMKCGDKSAKGGCCGEGGGGCCGGHGGKQGEGKEKGSCSH